MGGQVFAKFEYSGKGLLIILSGLPIYFLWRALQKRSAPAA
jgi:hypothetical protein